MEMFEMDTSAYRLHGFCAKDGLVKQICYILNKYETDKEIKFTNNYPNTTKVIAEILVDTDDHWGKVLTNEVAMTGVREKSLDYVVPGLSFITFTFDFQWFDYM